MNSAVLFKSFFMAGFECSTNYNLSRRRLDLIESTEHDRYALEDYMRLQDVGIRTARDGLRWHLIEKTPGHYDFSSVLPMLRAARITGTEVIWDLFHYGWPDDVDIFKPEFIRRLASLAKAFLLFYKREFAEPLFVCPTNEISYVAWKGGDRGDMNPFATSRGNQLKQQLVRANIEVCEALWSIDRRVRIVQIDPIIHIKPNPALADPQRRVDEYNEAQYAAWDMLAGYLNPELGGDLKYLDIIGANYYPKNQWVDEIVARLPIDDPRYRPLRTMLRDLYARYGRPLLISETGTEDDERAEWFRYVSTEVFEAMRDGVPIQGICLYPICNHPGWEDDRHCHNGLWDYCDESGERESHDPLVAELRLAQERLAELTEPRTRQVEKERVTERPRP